MRLLPSLPVLLLVATPLVAQMPAYPRIPPANGFRVFITTDMDGMGSLVFNREQMAGTEGERYRNSGGPDYGPIFRDLLTREVNAAIAGARRAGARSFVVNEGHGGNQFANLLPHQLDSAALLVRGWPKPLVMTTGLDSTAGAMFWLAAHAGPGTPGVMAHAYAFDRVTVNGRWMNETGLNALVAGEYGVPTVLVSGDDVLAQQAREILGPDVVCVVTKIAVGRTAAVTYSPAMVRQMLADSAAVAVRKVMRGEIRPFRLEKPYTVEFDIRRSFPPAVVAATDSIQGFRLEKTGERSYRLVTSDAREMARLFDAIEMIVLR